MSVRIRPHRKILEGPKRIDFAGISTLNPLHNFFHTNGLPNFSMMLTTKRGGVLIIIQGAVPDNTGRCYDGKYEKESNQYY